MIDDEHRILLGLYRESTSTSIVSETASQIIKNIVIDEKTYVAEEKTEDGHFFWKIFDEEHELSREEIEELYAMANMNRILRNKL